MRDPKIRNFIFDVGRVLVSYQADQMFLDHGLSFSDSERICREIFTNPYWMLSDYGTMPIEQILDGYGTIYPEDDQIFRWFFENCREQVIRRPRLWEMVHSLKEAGYGIYILSNYNDYFWEQQIEGLPFLEDADGVLVSFREHMVKPEPRFFKLLLDRYSLEPEGCLFMDDLADNTETAESLGITAVTVDSEDEIINILKPYAGAGGS